MQTASNDTSEQTVAARLAEFLEGAFESVALTRREHFRQHPEYHGVRALSAAASSCSCMAG